MIWLAPAVILVQIVLVWALFKFVRIFGQYTDATLRAARTNEILQRSNADLTLRLLALSQQKKEKLA